ncbi:MAG: Holliday junction branch migration protein RuvA [Fibrobacterota bacterium]
MYDFIRGECVSCHDGVAVIDTGAVGYALGVSDHTAGALLEGSGAVKLYTHYHITDNSHGLFGFINHHERMIFRILIGINKVGPKLALSILSTLTVGQIAAAVQREDSTGFEQVSGVGKKTASRLILELKDRIDLQHFGMDEQLHRSPAASGRLAPQKDSVQDEAYTALMALGYGDSQVRKAIAQINEQAQDDMSVQDWITQALRII